MAGRLQGRCRLRRRQPLIGRVALPGQAPEPLTGVASDLADRLATGTESPLHLGSGKGSKGTAAWLAVTDLDVPEVTAGQFLVSGDGGLRIWLNGHLIHERDTARALAPASGQLDATLARGTNRLLVEVVSSPRPPSSTCASAARAPASTTSGSCGRP